MVPTAETMKHLIILIASLKNALENPRENLQENGFPYVRPREPFCWSFCLFVMFSNLLVSDGNVFLKAYI